MTLAILTIAFVTVHVVFGADAQQKSFSSPEEAVRALIDAGEKNDTKAILEILGPEAKSFIETGDPVSDREARERFNKSYDEANKLVKTGDTKAVLQVGKDEWPLPIPLVKGSTGWRFDTKEGKEEILNRRIGRNELDVIQVCLAHVDAQREYYQRNPQKDPLLQYAQKFISTKGSVMACTGRPNPMNSQAPLGRVSFRPRPRDIRALVVSLSRTTATITRSSPGKDPTRQVEPTIISYAER